MPESDKPTLRKVGERVRISRTWVGGDYLHTKRTVDALSDTDKHEEIPVTVAIADHGIRRVFPTISRRYSAMKRQTERP
ncbi:MAG: hypothetical protein QGF00_21880 [Planctomycetota bacterium]|nr:hypothetical protein [Planctomycetota bacterium]MDP7252275.1 hypothetical protein [Planctomycetota bacterium]